MSDGKLSNLWQMKVINPEEDSMGYNREIQEIHNYLSSVGSRGHFKVTPEMLGVIEKQIEADDGTTVSQPVEN